MSESELAGVGTEQAVEAPGAAGSSLLDAAQQAPAEAIEDSPVPTKRRKMSVESTEKLEQRLGGILCCSVCLDLPCAAVYQCTNGHLMCAACFAHLLADARLRDESATCPNCRIEISKALTFRNLAVEKAVSELPSQCRFCTHVVPRHSLQNHEKKLCEESKFSQIVVNARNPKYNSSLVAELVRIVACFYQLISSAFRRSYFISEPAGKQRTFLRLTGCKYGCIGCEWRGPHHSLAVHEAACAHPRRSAADVLDVVAARDRTRLADHALFQQVLELFSYEKITFNDLQLKPYRTDEFVNKLYYETSRFPAFAQQWVVKAFVNPSHQDPTQTNHREITYQVIMKSKSPSPIMLQYMALRGPYGDADISARIHSHKFTAAEDAAEAIPLPLSDARDTNRLLSNKIIQIRLLMFMPSK